MMQNMVPNIHFKNKINISTIILYNDDVNTMACAVDKVLDLGTYLMDRVLVLNMWWIWF